MIDWTRSEDFETATTTIYWHQSRMAVKVHLGLNTSIYLFQCVLFNIHPTNVVSVLCPYERKISQSRTAPAQQISTWYSEGDQYRTDTGQFPDKVADKGKKLPAYKVWHSFQSMTL